MGYVTEFNWVLKLKEEHGFPDVLDIGALYNFRKSEKRIYPAGIPVFLVDSLWNVCASVIIKEFTVKDDITSGTFEIVRVFSADEKEVLGKVMREMYGRM